MYTSHHYLPVLLATIFSAWLKTIARPGDVSSKILLSRPLGLRFA
jgi:hypothetical protein